MRNDGSIEVLPLSVAIDLAHALVKSASDAVGVRALFIKGPIANFHGVRRHRIPSDVDVLVHPDDLGALKAEMIRRGWVQRPESFAHRSFVTHSITLLHDEWPCDVDIHRSFPGFLLDEAAAFEVLWRRREQIELASTPVSGSDLTSSVIIAALHALRAMYLTRHADEFSQALAAVRAQPDVSALISDILSLAEEIGATAPLTPFLEELGVAVPAPESDDPKLLEWQRNTRQLNRAASWLVAILEVRTRDRARYIWRAIFPSVEDLIIDHPSTPKNLRGLSATWILRLLHAMKALPTAVHVVWTERRRAADTGTSAVAAGSRRPMRNSENQQGVQGESLPNPYQLGGAADEDASEHRTHDHAAPTACGSATTLRRADQIAEVRSGGAAYLIATTATGARAPLIVTGSGLAIWGLLEEAMAPSAVVSRTAESYGLEPSLIEAQVADFLQALLEARLLNIA